MPLSRLRTPENGDDSQVKKQSVGQTHSIVALHVNRWLMSSNSKKVLKYIELPW